MKLVLSIALFGGLGCVSRYYLSGWVYERLGWHFPWGTLAVNICGAFIIGLLMELSLRSAHLPPTLRIGLVTGFLGGLTTFSTFSYETFRLLESGNYSTALVNVMVSVTVCLVFTWVGVMAAKAL